MSSWRNFADARNGVIVGVAKQEAVFYDKSNLGGGGVAGAVGQATEDLPRIFERFYRAQEPGTESIGGTGLGLSLSYDIIKAHGGEIKITNEKGGGTTFTLFLPNNG